MAARLNRFFGREVVLVNHHLTRRLPVAALVLIKMSLSPSLDILRAVYLKIILFFLVRVFLGFYLVDLIILGILYLINAVYGLIGIVNCGGPRPLTDLVALRAHVLIGVAVVVQLNPILKILNIYAVGSDAALRVSPLAHLLLLPFLLAHIHFLFKDSLEY